MWFLHVLKNLWTQEKAKSFFTTDMRLKLLAERSRIYQTNFILTSNSQLSLLFGQQLSMNSAQKLTQGS